jgi:hypothetical protein
MEVNVAMFKRANVCVSSPVSNFSLLKCAASIIYFAYRYEESEHFLAVRG